jgi:(S)-sulfolactate dehydrogenase
MSKILVSEYLPDVHLERLRSRHDVVYDPDLGTDRTRLLEQVADVEAIFTRNRTQVDVELIDAAHSLRVVGRLGVGLDNIDMERCGQAGIKVIPARGANAVSVAEYVVGAMFVLVRGVYGMTPSMLAGEWPRQGHAFGRELMGQTLGLVGFGTIAREVASRALALGMRIIAHDPFLPEDAVMDPIRRADLHEVLVGSDVVSLHVPLDVRTRGLIDATALAMMKPTAILINTSRGGVVDENALAEALRNRTLGGAALDVFATEPLDPEAAAVFADAPNLLLSPHVAGNAREAVDRVATMIVDAVMQELDREPSG